MASTLTSILLHITFSTKSRADLITPGLEQNLFDYMGGICRRMDSPLLAAGGTANHVHVLIGLAKTVALSSLMMELKRDSSKMLKHQVPHFTWQDGYFGFSIGESARNDLVRYIATQKEHHQTVDYRDEMRAFCRKYGIEIVKEFAWD